MEENVIQINAGVTINNDASVFFFFKKKKGIYVKKIIFAILLHVVAKMVDIQQILWMILWLGVMKLQRQTKKQKQFKQILIKKNATCETKNLYIVLAFLLITITLLIAVSIYRYLIKYKAKQKHLLSFYITNNELKEVVY